MLSEDANVLITILYLGLSWLLSAICLSKILVESPKIKVNILLALIPIAQIWAIAAIGKMSGWILFVLIVFVGVVSSLISASMIQSTPSILTVGLGEIGASMATSYVTWIWVTMKGRFRFAHLLALLIGIPIVGPFLLIHVAWKGQWS